MEYIAKFGYLGILIGTFFEGEITVLLGGIFSRFGFLEIKRVILWAFLGTFSGDSTFFILGRVLGRHTLTRIESLKKGFSAANRIVDRYGGLILFFVRFLTGLRSLILMVLGCSNMGIFRFIAITLINAFLWSLAVGLTGYIFAHVVFLFFEDIKKYQALAIPIFASIIFLIVTIVRKVTKKRELENGD